jgi:hypothetical protein
VDETKVRKKDVYAAGFDAPIKRRTSVGGCVEK